MKGVGHREVSTLSIIVILEGVSSHDWTPPPPAYLPLVIVGEDSVEWNKMAVCVFVGRLKYSFGYCTFSTIVLDCP